MWHWSASEVWAPRAPEWRAAPLGLVVQGYQLVSTKELLLQVQTGRGDQRSAIMETWYFLSASLPEATNGGLPKASGQVGSSKMQTMTEVVLDARHRYQPWYSLLDMGTANVTTHLNYGMFSKWAQCQCCQCFVAPHHRTALHPQQPTLRCTDASLNVMTFLVGMKHAVGKCKVTLQLGHLPGRMPCAEWTTLHA